MAGYAVGGAGVLLAVRVATLCLCGLVLQGAAAAPAYAQAGELVTGQPASTFNVEQLDALLAPIALYPDPLLTQMLMASVYPVEIVQAARWLEDPANKNLTGDALAKALESQNWDPSVKSLVAFPQVLQMMNEQLDWTQQLGYAFASQQTDVVEEDLMRDTRQCPIRPRMAWCFALGAGRYRAAYPGLCSFPGGHVEQHEALIDACHPRGWRGSRRGSEELLVSRFDHRPARARERSRDLPHIHGLGLAWRRTDAPRRRAHGTPVVSAGSRNCSARPRTGGIRPLFRHLAGCRS